MRFYEKSQLILSEDTLNVPQQIRFAEAFEDVDVTNIAEAVSRQEAFVVGTTSIPLEQISTSAAALIFIKPASDINISINGGTAFTVLGGKRTKMWVKGLTSLDVIVSGQPIQVLIVVGGT